MANTLTLHRSGAVGFIAWLGLVLWRRLRLSPVATKSQRFDAVASDDENAFFFCGGKPLLRFIRINIAPKSIRNLPADLNFTMVMPDLVIPVRNQQNCRDPRRDGAQSKPDRKWQKAHRPNENKMSDR